MFLSLLLVFSSSNDLHAMNFFPYAKFFNISEAKVDSFSHYFCGIKHGEDKCCECMYGFRMGDTCIDQNWDPLVHNDLSEYLNETFFKQKFEHDVYENTCEPILNHVPASSGHLVEHVELTSYLFNSYSNITDCIDYKANQLRKEFNIIPLSNETGFYYSKDCLDVLGWIDTFKGYMPIKVYCVKTNNLTLDMVFNVESLNLLEKCIFVADIFNDTHLENEVRTFRCAYQRGFCDRDNQFYDLCNTYYAPIRGYKNIHCALCDNQTWNHYEKVEQCTNCPRGECDLRKLVDRTTYPLSFSLIPDKEGTEYRVKNITTAFPIKEFFGIGSEVVQQYKMFLCNETKGSCCNCEKNCMKYHSCCVDILWNATYPLEMKEYKNLLIRKASEYKIQDCVHLISLVKENSKKYQMVTKCFLRHPISLKNKGEESKCLNPDSSKIKSIIPVLGEDGYLYRNMYCAQCNGMHTYKPINLTCYTLFNDLFDMEGCTFGIDDEESNTVRECTTDFEKNCDPADINYGLCNAYEGNIGIFKNYHCLLCKHSGSSLPSINKCKERDDIRNTRDIKTTVSFEMSTFRVSSIKPSKEHMCETDNIFELFGDGCRKRKIRLLTDDEFDRCFDRRNLSLFTKERIQRESRSLSKWELFLQSLFKFSTRLYMNNSNEFIYSILTNQRIITRNMISIYVDSFKKSLEKNEVKYFFLSSTKEPFISKKYELDFGSTFPNKRICHKMNILDRSKVSFTNSCQIYYNENTLYNTSEVSMWIRLDSFTVSRFVAVCEQFYMDPKNCSLDTVNIFHFSIDSNQIISCRDNGVLVHKTVAEYTPMVASVIVCPSTNLTNHISRYTKYTIIVGISLNLVFYVKNIHALYPIISLRSHVFLTSNLFLLDASYLFSTVLDEFLLSVEFLFRKIISLVSHFAFIMVQVWCLICCLEFWSYFDKNLFRFSRFGFNVILSFLITFLVIVSGFFMDYFGFIYLGYNNGDTCMSNAFIGQLCFFIIPMVLSIISSAFVLSRVIAYISMKKKEEDQTTFKRNNLQLVYLSFKIVSIVEFFEVIGFIREYDDRYNEKNVFFSIFGLSTSLVKGFRGAIMCYIYYRTKKKMNGTKNMVESRKTIISTVLNEEVQV